MNQTDSCGFCRGMGQLVEGPTTIKPDREDIEITYNGTWYRCDDCKEEWVVPGQYQENFNRYQNARVAAGLPRIQPSLKRKVSRNVTTYFAQKSQTAVNWEED